MVGRLLWEQDFGSSILSIRTQRKKRREKGSRMPNDSDGVTGGGESGQAQADGPGADYDKWYNVGQKMEAAKDQGKSY